VCVHECVSRQPSVLPMCCMRVAKGLLNFGSSRHAPRASVLSAGLRKLSRPSTPPIGKGTVEGCGAAGRSTLIRQGTDDKARAAFGSHWLSPCSRTDASLPPHIRPSLLHKPILPPCPAPRPARAQNPPLPHPRVEPLGGPHNFARVSVGDYGFLWEPLAL